MTATEPAYTMNAHVAGRLRRGGTLVAQVVLTLAALLLLPGCGDDETEPGPGEGGGGTGGGTPQCHETDPFDPAACPASYPDYECVVYVDGDVDARGDGFSWASAVKTVQEGIDLARCGALNTTACEQWQVWVKQGTYYIQQACRFDTVRLRPHVGVYGGFAGTEDTLPDRDWDSNETILDGRDGAGEGANHVYHVVTGADDAVLDGVIVQQGLADHDSDELYRGGAGMLNMATAPFVTRCTFRDNFALDGGAGMANVEGSSPTVEDCTFRENRTDGVGAGMLNRRDSAPAVNRCEFVENEAGAEGGGVFNTNGSPTITDCTFSGNRAGGSGAGMGNLVSEARIEHCVFRNNTAAQSSGGMWNGASEPTVESCLFEDNVAHSGGGMGVYSGGSTVIDCTFDGNQAVESEADPWANGGGLAIGSDSTVTLTGSTFTGNTAALNSGAVHIYKAEVAVSDCSFDANQATLSAGGMLIQESVVTVDRCEFSNNAAVEAGGGMAVLASTADVTNSSFRDNTAQVLGGGVAMAGGAAVVSLVNSVFHANQASEGGAIEAGGAGPLSLLNCTIAANEATSTGEGIANAADLTVTNSILWCNTADCVAQSGATAISVTYTDIEDAAYADPTNLHVDPLFVDEAAGDLHLQSSSPCIDLADAGAAPATDLDGNPRTGPPDMGAYEYQP